MRELVVKIGLWSSTLVVAGLLILPTTAHAESKKEKGSIFGKSYDHDFTPAGGDPARGPGFLDNAVVRLGNTTIGGSGVKNGQSLQEISRAERERRARAMQNRSIDATSPR